MAGEIGHAGGTAAPPDIGRRSGHHGAEWRRQPDHHHVLRDHLAQPDAGVETFANDVDETLIGKQLDGHVRIAFRHCRHHGRHRQGDGDMGHVDPEQPGRTAADAADAVHAFGDVLKGRGRRLDQCLAGLGQRDAARRAGEQRLTDPLLDKTHRMADRRRAHAELRRGKREAAAPRDGDDDRQMAEQIAIHC